MRADSVRQDLTDYLEGVRFDLFGRLGPPFRTSEEAARWLRAESEGGDTSEFQSRRAGLVQVARDFYEHLKNVEGEGPTGLDIAVSVGSLLIPTTEQPTRWVVATTPALYRTAEAVRYISSDFIGCTRHEAATAILLGTPLRIPSRLKRPLLAPKDKTLLSMAEELEAAGMAVPTGQGRGTRVGVQDYWERMRLKWNERAERIGERQYQHWTALAHRYRQIQKRKATQAEGEEWPID